MARGGKEQREGNALKTALVVTGGLVLVWMTVETAFGSLLSRLRGAIARSDPHTDPDDDVDAPDPATSAPPPEDDKDEPESENPSPSTGT